MIGYRKLIVTLVGIGSANLALALYKLEPSVWASMVAGLVAGFMALNSLAKSKGQS